MWIYDSSNGRIGARHLGREGRMQRNETPIAGAHSGLGKYLRIIVDPTTLNFESVTSVRGAVYEDLLLEVGHPVCNRLSTYLYED